MPDAAPVRARRGALDGLDRAGDHPGLTLHRYLARLGDPEARVDFLGRVVSVRHSDAYGVAFQRWRRALGSVPRTRTFELALQSPLAIGLGTESPLEIGLRLHHTYGTPIIPGSSLKGLARRAARLQPDELLSSEQRRVLFGPDPPPPGKRRAAAAEDAAGFCTFWDAWMVPGDGPFLKRDVVTVHHPDYYAKRGAGGTWPTDFDDPNPVAFVVVRPGIRFLFALSLADDTESGEWAACAEKMLTWSLLHLGVGAKTSAGYGFFADSATLRTAPAGSVEGARRTDPGPAAGKSAPPVPVPASRGPQVVVWENATIVRNANDGELTATAPEGGARRARSSNEAQVCAALSEEQKAALRDRQKGRRIAGVRVEVELHPNHTVLLRALPGADATGPE